MILEHSYISKFMSEFVSGFTHPQTLYWVLTLCDKAGHILTYPTCQPVIFSVRVIIHDAFHRRPRDGDDLTTAPIVSGDVCLNNGEFPPARPS